MIMTKLNENDYNNLEMGECAEEKIHNKISDICIII